MVAADAAEDLQLQTLGTNGSFVWVVTTGGFALTMGQLVRLAKRHRRRQAREAIFTDGLFAPYWNDGSDFNEIPSKEDTNETTENEFWDSYAEETTYGSSLVQDGDDEAQSGHAEDPSGHADELSPAERQWVAAEYED